MTLRRIIDTLDRIGLHPRIIRQFLRFNVAGIIIAVIFWLLYELFYFLQLHPELRAESAWIASYVISSVQAHFVHYRFTFKSQRSYLPSLWRTLTVYSTSLVLSTMSEYMLVSKLGLNHRLAWAINASFFGAINFMLLRHFAFVDTTRETPSTTRGQKGPPTAL